MEPWTPARRVPAWIRQALAARGLEDAWEARPAYQRNDYVGWIVRARSEATRQQRLAQMLRELETGDLYMDRAWRPSPDPLSAR